MMAVIMMITGTGQDPHPVISNGILVRSRVHWHRVSAISDRMMTMVVLYKKGRMKTEPELRWRMRNISSISRHNSNLRQPWNVINLSRIYFLRAFSSVSTFVRDSSTSSPAAPFFLSPGRQAVSSLVICLCTNTRATAEVHSGLQWISLFILIQDTVLLWTLMTPPPPTKWCKWWW